MAASINRLRTLALRNPRHIPSRRKPFIPPCPFRPLHITPLLHASDSEPIGTKFDPSMLEPSDLEEYNLKSPEERAEIEEGYLVPVEHMVSAAVQDELNADLADVKFDPSMLDPSDLEQYNLSSPEEKTEIEKACAATVYHFNRPAVQDELNAHLADVSYDIQKEFGGDRARPEKIKPGLMAMGEVDEQGTGEDEEYRGDDISSLAHGELEQHREMREYARIAAWEMPLLSSTSPAPSFHSMGIMASMENRSIEDHANVHPELAKPFTPPSKETPLRFRYTTYMGETHPAASKIVLEFCTADLPSLSPAQRTKLIKLVGPRYNPETDVVKMSSEMFETQAQNKRYLGDLVDTLLTEARNEEDMFEDVPLDFRHHTFKPKVVFPEKWKMGKEKRRALEGERERRKILEERRVGGGQIADGMKIIAEGMQNLPKREEQKILVQAQLGKGGKKPMKGKIRR